MENTFKRILLVEDDSFITELFTMVLREVGYIIETAANGEEGLKKIRQNFYDIILLDIMMPKMDGLTMLETVAKENIKHGKIVMLTNLGWDVAKQAALKNGAVDYWLKSEIMPKDLPEKIRKL